MASTSVNNAIITSLQPSTSVVLPYDWSDISEKLQAPTGISDSVLNSPFLDLWTQYRDSLPLKPDASMAVSLGNKQDAMPKLVETIYKMMENMCLCRYDSLAGRQNWTSTEHAEALIYQVMRSLTVPGQTFGSIFDLASLRYATGRQVAYKRIEGVIMLVLNLIADYSSGSPGQYIRDIETAKPACNPEWSPLPDVRMKNALERMDVEELRKKVLEEQRKDTGKDEKAWLVDMLLKHEEEKSAGKKNAVATPRRKVVKKKAAGRTVQRRRKMIEISDDEE